MVTLHRTSWGDYFTHRNNLHFHIEKGCQGWNLFLMTTRQLKNGDSWESSEYITTCDTLKECRETIETYQL